MEATFDYQVRTPGGWRTVAVYLTGADVATIETRRARCLDTVPYRFVPSN